MIGEPDVTLTDYALAVESGAFAWLLDRRSVVGRWFGCFFVAIAAASLVGGTVHGLFADPAALGARILWPATLLAIGATAFTLWGIGAHVLLPSARAAWIVRVAGVELAAYGALVLAGVHAFAIAVWNYLPAAIFLLFALATRFMRTRERAALVGCAGVLLSFVAGGVQQTGITPHARFGHNALYHVIQGVALVLLFACARGIGREHSC